MLIELRAADDRLRGPKALDAAPILTSTYKAVVDSEADLTDTRVVADFIQYRQNFRDTVELRRVQPWRIEANGSHTNGDHYEIAIDLRRAKADTIENQVTAALNKTDADRIALED